MSENNNEADALFATRRKKIQDEEAEKEARKAEQDRLEELERQKQAMLEDIKRLEALQAEKKAQAEKDALETQRAKAERESKKSLKASGSGSPIKKYLPIIIGGCAVLILVTVLIIVKIVSKPNSDKKDTEQSGSSSVSDISDKNTADGQKSKLIGSDVPEDYYEDGSPSLTSLLSSSVWYKVDEKDNENSYIYPSIFNVEYNDEGDAASYIYYDEGSKQTIDFSIDVCSLEEFEEDDIKTYGYRMILDMTMSVTGIEKYEVASLGDNIWYATESLDDKNPGEMMMSMFISEKEDKYVQMYFSVTKEDEGSRRYIDFDDVLYIFNMVYDSIPVG